jgi:hypothetical protein
MTAPPCRNDCAAPLLFPAPISNRPGLPHIAFRIGAYSDIREYLLRQLDVDRTQLHLVRVVLDEDEFVRTQRHDGR